MGGGRPVQEGSNHLRHELLQNCPKPRTGFVLRIQSRLPGEGAQGSSEISCESPEAFFLHWGVLGRGGSMEGWGQSKRIKKISKSLPNRPIDDCGPEIKRRREAFQIRARMSRFRCSGWGGRQRRKMNQGGGSDIHRKYHQNRSERMVRRWSGGGELTSSTRRTSLILCSAVGMDSGALGSNHRPGSRALQTSSADGSPPKASKASGSHEAAGRDFPSSLDVPRPLDLKGAGCSGMGTG